MKFVTISCGVLASMYATSAFVYPRTATFVSKTAIGSTKYTLDGKEIDKPFTPMNNMLLLKKFEVVDQTSGGIFLTGKAKIDRTEGIVVATGPGRMNQETGFQYPMPVSLGEIVVYGKFDGQEIVYNGEKNCIIRDDDVLVKFKGGDEQCLENADVVWDNVLVKVIKAKEAVSTGGILFAKTSKKTSVSSIGEVVKVGPGRYAFNGSLMGMDVAVGDMVKYRDFSAAEVEINGENFAVLKMTDILAKF